MCSPSVRHRPGAERVAVEVDRRGDRPERLAAVARCHLDESRLRLRVGDHVDDRLHRRPPHVVLVETLGPLAQRSGGERNVELGDQLRGVASCGLWRRRYRGSSARSGRSSAASTFGQCRSASRQINQKTRSSPRAIAVDQRRPAAVAWLGRLAPIEAQLDPEVPGDRVHPGAQQARRHQAAPARCAHARTASPSRRRRASSRSGGRPSPTATPAASRRAAPSCGPGPSAPRTHRCRSPARSRSSPSRP